VCLTKAPSVPPPNSFFLFFHFFRLCAVPFFSYEMDDWGLEGLFSDGSRARSSSRTREPLSGCWKQIDPPPGCPLMAATTIPPRCLFPSPATRVLPVGSPDSVTQFSIPSPKSIYEERNFHPLSQQPPNWSIVLPFARPPPCGVPDCARRDFFLSSDRPSHFYGSLSHSTPPLSFARTDLSPSSPPFNCWRVHCSPGSNGVPRIIDFLFLVSSPRLFLSFLNARFGYVHMFFASSQARSRQATPGTATPILFFSGTLAALLFFPASSSLLTVPH